MSRGFFWWSVRLTSSLTSVSFLQSFRYNIWPLVACLFPCAYLWLPSWPTYHLHLHRQDTNSTADTSRHTSYLPTSQLGQLYAVGSGVPQSYTSTYISLWPRSVQSFYFNGCVRNLFELPLKAIAAVVIEQDSQAVREVNLSVTVFSTTDSFGTVTVCLTSTAI
jgi:hypothetical protein